MNALNRAIFREIMEGNIVWGSHMRFAEIGNAHLCRQSGNDMWHLVITSGNQIRLGVINQIALRIAAKYYTKKKCDCCREEK